MLPQTPQSPVAPHDPIALLTFGSLSDGVAMLPYPALMALEPVAPCGTVARPAGLCGLIRPFDLAALLALGPCCSLRTT